MAAAGAPPPLEPLALDGKSLRGSCQQGAAESHLVSILSHRLGLVVAQLAVSDKSHELGQLEPLLAALVLEGRVITADALHTQRTLAVLIVARGGDYLLPVKDNQPAWRQDIALVFAHAQSLADTISQARTIEQHGDRIEERSLRASTSLADYTDWPGHQQVLELRRTITNKRTGAQRAEVGAISEPALR